MLTQKQSPQSIAATVVAAHQTLPAAMAVEIEGIPGSAPGPGNKEPTTPHKNQQNMAQSPASMEREDSCKNNGAAKILPKYFWGPSAPPSNLPKSSNREPTSSPLVDIGCDFSWDVGPDFVYWPFDNLGSYKRSHPFGLDIPPQSPNISQWQAGTCSATISSRSTQDTEPPSPLPKDSFSGSNFGETIPWEDSSGILNNEPYFAGHIDLDDVSGWQDIFWQDLGLKEETPSMASTPDNARNTIETRPCSRASTATIFLDIESGRPDHKSATPGPLESPLPNRRLLPCGKCDKHFQDKTALTRHLRYHSRPFSCLTCSRQFSVTKDLRRHQQAAGHDGQVIKKRICPVEGCEFSSGRIDNLRRHCWSRHDYVYMDKKKEEGKLSRAAPAQKGAQNASCINVP